jgi:hypothetical protein
MPTPDAIRAAAVAEAETALETMGENVENLRTLIRLYGDAVWTATHLRGLWQAEGGPSLAVGPRGALYPHPALKLIRDAERHASNVATPVLTCKRDAEGEGREAVSGGA